MNFKGITTVGLGIIVGLMIDHMLTKQDDISEKKSDPIDKAKEELKKYSTYLNSCSGDRKADDIEYVTDDELTDAMELSKDDTPDDVDMLFIEPIRFDNISTAYSIMGEVMGVFENGDSVSVHDILRWLNEYAGYNTYVYNIKLKYGSKLEDYGWVDPSDFSISHNDTLGGYTITTAVPVRLKTNNV